MTNQDKKKFGCLMLTIGEMSSGSQDMRTPSEIKIELFFQGLKDLSLDRITENTALYFKNNRKAFFPTIADLRNEPDPEDVAREKFDAFQDVINNYYAIGYSSSLDIVIMKLKQRGLADLIPYLDSYGVEIVNQNNISATRAQFVKQYTAHQRIETSHQIERSGEMKRIGDVLAGLIDEGNDKLKVKIE